MTKKNNENEVKRVRPLGDIEQNILGAILLDNNSMDTASQILKPQMFGLTQHQIIYAAMLDMYDNGIPIDTISLGTKLKDSDLDLETGGAVYLSKLSLNNISSANIEFHSKLIYQNWLRRELLYQLELSIRKVINSSDDYVFNLHSEILSKLENLTNDISGIKPIKSLGEKLGEALTKIEDRLTKEDAGGLKSTSFPTFNHFTGGIRESDFIAVHGDYKQGKSTFALQLALDIALNSKIPVGIFSLEMDEDSLNEKSFSLRTGIDYLKLRAPKENKLTAKELQKLQGDVAVKFKNAPLYISDQCFDKHKIKAEMKYLVKKFGVKFFMVDYISLIVNSVKSEHRYLELAELSRYFKLAAKELRTPIMMLSQSNNEGKIAESKGLARDADFVIYVSKPKEKGMMPIKIRNGKKNIKGEDEYQLCEWLEKDFLIQLTHSRHGMNGYYFVCRYLENNFVEIDEKTRLNSNGNGNNGGAYSNYYEPKETEEIF